MIGGVAGGLAEFFNVDSTLIRIIFILLTVFGGSGILLYLILWLIIPSESTFSEITQENIRQNADEIKEKANAFAENFHYASQRENSRNLAGIILITGGLLFLLSNLGLFHIFNLAKLWPLILIAIGLAALVRNEQ